MTKVSLDRRIPFSVNHYVCPPEISLIDFLDLVVLHGFSGVGLTERAFDEMSVGDIENELRVRNLSISSVNTAGYFLYEGERAEKQRLRNLELLDWCSRLGGAALNVIVGGVGAGAPLCARDRVLRSLSDYVERAEARGVPLMLEPLHPIRFRDRSCVNTLASSQRIQETLPDLNISLDLFHLWWDPDLDDWLHGNRGKVGVLQICDLAGEAGDLRRVPLGEGYLDWSSYVVCAQKHLQGVPIELELFAEQLPGRTVSDVLSVSSRSLKLIL